MRGDRLILRELRAGRAGVVGQDAKPPSDRKPHRHVGIDLAAHARDDSMLLAGARQPAAFDHIASRVAYGAIAIVDFLALRSAVTAHGHPARIDDGPAFL